MSKMNYAVSIVIFSITVLFGLANPLFADVNFHDETIDAEDHSILQIRVELDESHDLLIATRNEDGIRVEVLQFDLDDYQDMDAWFFRFAFEQNGFDGLKEYASRYRKRDFDIPNGENVGAWIQVYGFGGHDILILNDSLAMCEIYGGDGDDLIQGCGFDTEGRVNRLFGEAGRDQIHGGPCQDEIHGGPGNDKIWGYNRRDEIFGDEGDDDIYGGSGNDVLYGGIGDDYIEGGEGDDMIRGWDGDDILYGGPGYDEMFGGDGQDEMEGNEDSDIMHGGDDNDTMNGNGGGDVIYGEGHSDTIYGGIGNDWIEGGAGRDKLYGGHDHDDIFGGDDNDRLYGGHGEDSLFGGKGIDRVDGGYDGSLDFLHGGEDNDYFVFRRYVRVEVRVPRIDMRDSRLTSNRVTTESFEVDVQYEQLTVEMDKVLDFESGDEYVSVDLTD